MSFLDPREPLPDAKKHAAYSRRVTLESSRGELLLIMWRISEALRALPDDAGERQVTRWRHGIAREIVGVVKGLMNVTFNLFSSGWPYLLLVFAASCRSSGKSVGSGTRTMQTLPIADL